MSDDRRRGPGRMSAGELSAFLAARPSGAICVVDDHGRLLAVPARVLDERDGIIHVDVGAVELAFTSDGERPACMVADSFESYDGIRGFIAQGHATPGGTAPANPTVALTVTRRATFSFAEDRQRSKDVQAVPN
jgi:hypothetical protein